MAFVAGCPLDQLYISAVTLAEFRFGIELVDEPNRRADLNDWLRSRSRPMFGGRVLQITEDIMLNGGFWLRKAGRRGIRSLNRI